MHKDFAEWYRLVSLVPDSDKLPKRWAGVMEWVSNLHDDDAILETVRIFQGLPEKVARDGFLAAFRKHDPAFPQRNELELRVLAGASIVECVWQATLKDDGLDAARAAIIAGTALEASNLRASGSEFDEVRDAVRAGLHALARRSRRRMEFETTEIGEKNYAAAEAMKQVADSGNLNQLKEAVAPLLQALVDSARQSKEALAAAAHNLRCADEETNILWWLEGGCSRDLDKPWSALKEAAPLVAAWELADLTDVALGPQDAAAFLERVVVAAKGKEQPLHAYVNALPDNWAKKCAKTAGEKGLDLAPLALALSRRGASDTLSWQQYFDSTSGLKSSTALAPERVARQGYVEAVLLRTLAETES